MHTDRTNTHRHTHTHTNTHTHTHAHTHTQKSKQTNNKKTIVQVLGANTGALLESVMTVIAGFSMAVAAEWRTALLITAFAPLTFLGCFIQGKVQIWAEQSHSQYMTDVSEVRVAGSDNGKRSMCCQFM